MLECWIPGPQGREEGTADVGDNDDPGQRGRPSRNGRVRMAGRARVSFRRVSLFLALTFAISWGTELLTSLTTGQSSYAQLGLSPVQMLVPAWVALVLQMFVFKDSRLYFRKDRGSAVWILNGFLVLAPLYGAVTVLALLVREQRSVFAGIGNLVITLWVLTAFFLHGRVGEDGFRRVGLQLAAKERGFAFVIGVVTFFLGSAAFNLLFGLGEWRGPVDRIYGVPVPEQVYPLALFVSFIGIAMIGLPLTQIAVVFGEEYAWRGFLQEELCRLGARRGVLLVGVIWGMWHFPVILSGTHTYPPSPFGLFLALAFFVGWGFIQSFAVLRTGSIWVPAFLHGLVNSTYAFTLTNLVRPDDMVFSFGLGVFGLVVLGLIVSWVLRSPVWDGQADAGVVQPPGFHQEAGSGR